MELNLDELVNVTGAMTREERDDALKPRDDDGFYETTVKDIARPFVKGIDHCYNKKWVAYGYSACCLRSDFRVS